MYSTPPLIAGTVLAACAGAFTLFTACGVCVASQSALACVMLLRKCVPNFGRVVSRGLLVSWLVAQGWTGLLRQF